MSSAEPISILLPHRRNPGNDAALRICLDMLEANTRADYVLLMDAACDQPLYPRIHRLVVSAPTECCVYWSSDMFPSPGWDAPMTHLFGPDTFVTNALVEPGAIGVFWQNITRDFGRKPETFLRAEFEHWSLSEGPNVGGEGWYAPFMFPKSGWLETAGTTFLDPVPSPWMELDVQLFERWKAAGHRVVRAQGSFVYHLQRYSDETEQSHEKRG